MRSNAEEEDEITAKRVAVPLGSILSSGASLKPTTTRITKRDGNVYEEKKNDAGDISSTYIGKTTLPSFLQADHALALTQQSPQISAFHPFPAVFFDWDCTITTNHMFSLLRSTSNKEAEDFKRIYAMEDIAKLNSFSDLVAAQRRYYECWGPTKPIDRLEAFCLEGSTLLPADSPIFEDLKVYLFGDMERQRFLASLLYQLTIVLNLPIFICTKGIGASVLGAIKAFFPEWLESYSIVIIDYAGIVYDPRSSSSVLSRTLPYESKLAQIDFYLNSVLVEKQDEMLSEKEASVVLIDDSFLECAPSFLSRELIHTSASGMPFYCKFFQKRKHILGGPARDGSGLNSADVDDILHVVKSLVG
jgi:hypothetical protein